MSAKEAKAWRSGGAVPRGAGVRDVPPLRHQDARRREE